MSDVDATDPALASALDAIQRAVLTHPVACQRAFVALMAEGRHFVNTDEGEAWKGRLEGTDLVRGLEVVWEAGTLGMLEDDPDVILPGALIEALASLAARNDLATYLSGWFEQRIDRL